MKKYKKFTVAIASMLLAFSAASAVTGTVAWFTAANTVNVSGMSIQAETENGIVIANETHAADSDWLTTITASHTGGANTFIPTSTSDLTDWYHGLSDQANNGQSNVDYDKFTGPIAVSNGIGSAMSTKHFPTAAKNVYLLNDFYVQASAKADITNQDIFIEKITMTGNTNSANLDKSIRVGLKVADSFVGIYAPLEGSTLNYTVLSAITFDNAGTPENEYTYTKDAAVAAIDVHADNDSNLVYTGNIPAYTTGGTNAIKFSVFIYFEGEDTNHKSANITNTLDTLALEFKLRNANHVNP